MKLKNLEKVLDKIFGQKEDSSILKKEIIDAVKKDIKKDLGNKEDVAEIIPMCNEVFGKRYRVMPKNIVNRYKEILRHFSIDDVRQAMMNAKENDFHKENGYTYCTPEYFSRVVQLEKWLNASTVKKSASTFVPISIRDGKQ
jgi:hypothetical protein